MTIAMLMSNTVNAAKLRRGKSKSETAQSIAGAR
jgi:hypothetical protein